MREKKLSRRDFLQTSAIGFAAAIGSPLIFPKHAEAFRRYLLNSDQLSAGNSMPGKIRICTDPRIAASYNSTISVEYVQNAFDQCLRALVPGRTPEGVLEYLMPGLTASTKIAIKINLIAPCDTRWEVVRAIVYRLSLCLNGTYDVSNVVIFDNHSPSGHGYTSANFTFNGKSAVLAGNSGGSSNVYPLPDYKTSYSIGRHIIDSTFVFNVPVIKDHSQFQITGSLKNHFGSSNPVNICSTNSPYTNILYFNANEHIKNKTVLIVGDMVRGKWDGGPGGSAQSWQTFTNNTPDSIMVTTDPVTNDYWYRYYINRERTHRGYSERRDRYINEASGSPWYLGVSDPGQMDMQSVDPVGFDEDNKTSLPVSMQMLPARPNPFTSKTEFPFILKEDANIEISIYDISGKKVFRQSRMFAKGQGSFVWKPNGIPAGVYHALIKHKSITYNRIITKL
ncbi:MAG: DUF362 domain-containing protein [Candidatus Coatesbacteria bacterium]|nr:DUF362 domain-containing protein [Candidatus Coatesbacteria bacterium]